MSAGKQKQIWIGLVGVRSLPNSEALKKITGAYVNVLTWASDRVEFQRKAQELMDSLHLMLATIENAEPLSNRGRIEELDDNIAELAARVRQNPDAIIYGTFHTWANKNN